MSQNLLYLAHGPFLSIIDLNSYKNLETHQHLSLYTKLRKNMYDMSNDVNSILILDKESTKIEERWKIVIVCNGGQIRKVVEKLVERIPKDFLEAETSRGWMVRH